MTGYYLIVLALLTLPLAVTAVSTARESASAVLARGGSGLEQVAGLACEPDSPAASLRDAPGPSGRRSLFPPVTLAPSHRVLASPVATAILPPPSVQGEGPHDYFNEMAARPDLLCAFSLRDQRQLDIEVRGPTTRTPITYDPANDRYPDSQDAAKVVVESGHTSSRQARFPIRFDSGSGLITWDAWWGAEFAFETGGVPQQKTFMIASPKTNSERWLEIRSRYAKAVRPYISTIDARPYGELGPNTHKAGNHINPMVGEFSVMPKTWTRFWVHVELIDGGFDRVSMWVADETRAAVQIYDRAEMEAGAISKFWIEYNASASRRARGAPGGLLVSYVRNLIVLKDVKDVRVLLRKPAR